MGLRALHEALAGRPAGADRDLALDDVEALAERVGGRVEQRADAVLLVVANHRPLHVGLTDAVFGNDDGSNRHRREHEHRNDQPPRQAGEEDHV